MSDESFKKAVMEALGTIQVQIIGINTRLDEHSALHAKHEQSFKDISIMVQDITDVLPKKHLKSWQPRRVKKVTGG